MLRSHTSRLLIAAATASFLTSCSTNSPLPLAPVAKGISGSVHGGQQPISAAAIQLYAVGTSGDGSAATPLLTSSVVTDASGNFAITALYACPSASAPVYITGTGGNPGSGITNPQIALIAALGPCGSLTASTFIDINEITTVAAVYALAPFMTSFSAVGSATSDVAALTSSFINAGYFANIATGTAPGLNLPLNSSVPVAQVNTIANLVAACINSAGGVSGDASVCGTFFALTLPSGGTPSTDTIAALLNLAKNPTLNTATLFNLIPPASPFQPTLSTVPPDFSLRLLAPSAFTISPSAIVFAPAVLSVTQATQTVTVANASSASVNITSSSITGVNASDFAVVPPSGSDCAATISANTTCTFQLSFTPSALGARAAYFIVGNTSANPSIAIALSGSGAAGLPGPVYLTPSNLAFSQLGVPQILTLTNAGSTALSISAIQLSNAAYTQTNNCASSLPAGSSCTINVSVTTGTVPSATLTVVDDASTGPQIVNLSYTPPGVIDFGHVAIGATVPQDVQVHGTGSSGTLDFTIGGPNTNNFSFSSNSSVLTSSCNYNYRQSMQCLITFYYTPSALGTSTASITSSGNFGPSSLTGTGDPAGVDFGLYQPSNPAFMYAAPITTLDLGSTNFNFPQTRSFQIKNTGSVTPLALKAPVLSGPNAADFTVTAPACDSGCSPSVTFTPTGNGIRSATLTYTDSTNTVIRTLALTGTGRTPDPVVTAIDPSVHFSNVPVGTVSAPQTVTVNAYQNHPIQASFAPVSSGGSQPFIFTGPTSCASTPCTLSIAYAPTSATDNGADVYVIATDTVGLSSGNIQALGLTGPFPFLRYNPTSLIFAAQALNTVSAPQTVTLTNAGTTVLMLTFSVQLVGGSGIMDYTLVNNCPASLAINATCTVDVRFAPINGGPTHTTLVIDGANNPGYVDLSGTAI